MVFKEYYVSNENRKGLFSCSRGIRLTKSDRIKGDIPLLTAGVGIGQGVAEYIAENPKMTLYEDDITIDMFGLCFFHDYQHYGDDNIHFLVNKNIDSYSKLYITSVLDKSIQGISYGRQFRMKTLNKLKIFLPTTEILDTNSPYSDEGFVPDFKYMAERIEELEAERIEELEAERIEELERYLVATGLNDYTLTEEDIKALSIYLSIYSGDQTQRYRASAPVPHKEMRSFPLQAILKVSSSKKKFNANSITINETKGNPYVVRSSNNNGIKGYTEEDEQFLNEGNTFSFGQDTATVFWQPKPYFTGDKIKILKPLFQCNEEIALFMIDRISTAFSNFKWGSQSFNEFVINNMPLNLPIQTDDSNHPIIDPNRTYHPDGYIPDWDFMERYIRAIEKIVIADVVKFRDEQIDKTREIINAP